MARTVRMCVGDLQQFGKLVREKLKDRRPLMLATFRPKQGPGDDL
jgi:hypothetical protein